MLCSERSTISVGHRMTNISESEVGMARCTVPARVQRAERIADDMRITAPLAAVNAARAAQRTGNRSEAVKNWRKAKSEKSARWRSTGRKVDFSRVLISSQLLSDGGRRADFPVRSNPERQRARVNYVAADWKVRAPLFWPPSLIDYAQRPDGSGLSKCSEAYS